MERMRISKDVHDDIGSGLSRISLLSAIARRKLHHNEAPESDINHISSLSRELVDNMRDLIWLLNPENTTLDSLAARIREYSADFLDAAGIAVHFVFPAQVPAMPVPHDVQRNVLLTVKEAVNNVVKHSGATEVTITLQYDGHTINISVADNGRGLPDDNGEQKGNGLRNMRYRIGSVGGTWFVASAPGEGTKITITIPLHQPAASGV
jgi:signal transduction histidine kinase